MHFWPTDPKTPVKNQRFDTGPQALPAGGHFSPDVLTNDSGTLATCALTNDFDGTEDKMFPVWRLKQFICFIDLQYKGKEIIGH